MSIIYDIRNLQSCNDFKNKRDDFYKTLRLQAKLNRNAEQAAITRQQMDALGIVPPVQARRSVEDERKDLVLQQQLALKNLRSIMSDEEAVKVIHLINNEQVYFLNTEFGRLKPYLEGRTNITADFFKRVLERFGDYLETTGGTGIPIPLREATLEQMPGDLKDEWEAYARQAVDPTTGKTPDLEELIDRTAETLGRSTDDIKQEVDSEMNMEVEQETPITPGAEPTWPAPPPPDTPFRRTPRVRRGQLPVTRDGRIQRARRQNALQRWAEERVADPDQVIEGLAPMPGEMPNITNARQYLVPDATATEEYVAAEIPIPPPPSEPERRGTRRAREGTIYRERVPDQRMRMDESFEERGIRRQAEQAIDTRAIQIARQGVLSLDEARRLARDQLAYRVERVGQTPLDGRQIGDRMLAARSESAREMTLRRASVPAGYGPAMNTRSRSRQAREATAPYARVADDDEGLGLFISPQRRNAEYGPITGYSKYSHGAGACTIEPSSRVVRRSGKILGKMGRGIQSNDDVIGRFREFGKYMIHMPSLRNNIINIKYPSQISIHGLPHREVSHQFSDIIYELLDGHEFNKRAFSKLSEEEKDYFSELAHKCEFDLAIGMGVVKKTTKAEQKELERFEMLRGTIIAGNNSPQVLQELKDFIQKFIKTKRISRHDGQQLLKEMQSLAIPISA